MTAGIVAVTQKLSPRGARQRKLPLSLRFLTGRSHGAVMARLTLS
jgi:hypothetical protein